MTKTYPWGDSRRFNAYSNYFVRTFGERVQKLSVDAGFTCPNRDGTLAHGGCTFCNNDAFSPSYCQPEKSVTQQLAEGMAFHQNRYRKTTRYLAYFQAYSNTYAPLEELQKLYDEALRFPDIIGIVIGTRPDCIDEEKLDYFQALSQHRYLILEYGIESCYDQTLQQVNRQHTFAQAEEAIRATADRGIRTGAHLIFGLPGESKDQMLAQAGILSRLPLNNIKFHQLQIIKNTKMAEAYQQNPQDFTLFDFEEYIDFMVAFVEQLNPAFVIERIAGEAPPDTLINKNYWKKRNDQILTRFEEELANRNTWQGKKWLAN